MFPGLGCAGEEVEELLGAATAHVQERSLATLPAQTPQQREGVVGQALSPSQTGSGSHDT